MLAALAGYAVTFAVVVAADGSPAGRIGRVAAVAVAAGLAVVARRRVASVGSVIAIVLATAGLAVGDALGYGRRVGADPTLRSITATLLLLSSTLLLITASVALVMAGRSRLQRVAVALTIVLFCIAARSLVVAPIADAVRVTNVVRVDVGSATPEDLGLAYEDVTFPADDGTMLSGWYLPSENGAAVVLAHGASSSRGSVLGHAAVLARHGYGVLTFDSRGQGRSAGRAMDLGWYGDADLRGAVSMVAGRDDVDPARIAVVGISLGGEEAIGAAASDERIAAVVADGAMYRRLGDWTPHHDEGVAERLIDGIMFRTADLLSDARPPIKLADAVPLIAPRPVLLIASGADGEIAAARELQSTSPTTVEVWEVPDAGHVGALDVHPEEWEEQVISFLDAALGR